MARTVQDAIDRVRELLQDQKPSNADADWAGERYMTPELLSYMVDAIDQARSVRPDLFLGKYADPIPPVVPLALTDPFPLPGQLFNGACYFIAGNAELRDDEFAVDGRAMTLKESYTKKLVSGM
jgi:hypothetical protein